jgi:hypothetical protein
VQWYIHVISATQETEVGRIVGPGQLGQKVHKTHLNRKIWVWRGAFVIPATLGSINRRIIVQAGLGEK